VQLRWNRSRELDGNLPTCRKNQYHLGQLLSVMAVTVSGRSVLLRSCGAVGIKSIVIIYSRHTEGAALMKKYPNCPASAGRKL